MSPKPVDIDHAVLGLKADGSTAEMRLKARQSLSSPNRKALPKLGFVGVATTAVVFLFWPRATAGRTWAQALRASAEAKVSHAVRHGANGEVLGEEWRQGRNQAAVLYQPDGKVLLEFRISGNRVYSYSNFGTNNNRALSVVNQNVGLNPNATLFGVVRTEDTSKHPDDGGEVEGHLDRMLALYKCEIVKQEPAQTKQGPAIRYELKSKDRKGVLLIVIVDDKSGLIVEMLSADGKMKTVCDYPASVDPKIFEPRPQAVKNCTVFDEDNEIEIRKKILAHGIAKSHGVTLRGVLLDGQGYLWVMWTGAPVSGRMEHPFTVSHAELGEPFGLPGFTTSASNGKNSPVITSDGAKLYGMAREAKTKIGDHIDISVPTKQGTVSFKSVLVTRISRFDPSYMRPKVKAKP